jgi:hypothetical protein
MRQVCPDHALKVVSGQQSWLNYPVATAIALAEPPEIEDMITCAAWPNGVPMAADIAAAGPEVQVADNALDAPVFAYPNAAPFPIEPAWVYETSPID